MTWTPERTKTLTRMWLDGKTATEIARHFGEGMSRNQVIGKVHRLKLVREAPNVSRAACTGGKCISWTTEEDAILRRTRADGLTARQLAVNLPGRSVFAIRDRRIKIGLKNERTDWSDDEIKTLREMTKDGYSIQAICDVLPKRNYVAVMNKRTMLGLRVAKFVVAKKRLETSKPAPPKPAPLTSTVQDIGLCVRGLNPNTCRFPHGDPKIEGFHFCCEPIKLGRIYCDDHRALCFRA